MEWYVVEQLKCMSTLSSLDTVGNKPYQELDSDIVAAQK